MSYFFGPNFKCFTNDAFCLHGFDYAYLRRLRHIVIKKFEIIKKLYLCETLLKMAGECGMHAQHTPHSTLLIKLWHCIISIAANNKIQETTIRNSCYYDNYKTRLSMTKYLALRNKDQEKINMTSFEAQWGL